MKGKRQWAAELAIKASAHRVWEIVDDITLVPSYHPDVGKVDLISGQSRRSLGARYQCSVLEGRRTGRCVEEVVDYVPERMVATGMVEDTWGVDKMLADFRVETTVSPLGEGASLLKFEAYYNPIGLKNWLLNVLVLRRVLRKRSLAVMTGIGRLAEEPAQAS